MLPQLLLVERGVPSVDIDADAITLGLDCLCLVRILRELEWRFLLRIDGMFAAGTFLLLKFCATTLMFCVSCAI